MGTNDKPYPHEVERYFISCLLSDETIFRECIGIMEYEYFGPPYHPQAVRSAKQHFAEHRTIPPVKLIEVASGMEIMDLSREPIDPEWFRREIVEFCRYNATQNVLLKGIDLMEEGKGDSLSDLMRQARSIGLDQPYKVSGALMPLFNCGRGRGWFA